MLAGVLLVALVATASADGKYPYRGDHPGVKTIETYDLVQGLESDEFVVTPQTSPS